MAMLDDIRHRDEPMEDWAAEFFDSSYLVFTDAVVPMRRTLEEVDFIGLDHRLAHGA